MRNYLYDLLTVLSLIALTASFMLLGPLAAHGQSDPNLDKISSSPIPQHWQRRLALRIPLSPIAIVGHSRSSSSRS